MGNANGVHMVPEKYRKTRFTASCWFYLSTNMALTFAEYQKLSKDKICRESVFDDTKKSMELDRLWNRPEAVKLPGETELPPARTPVPPPPKPPNQAMAVTLAEGLARSGSQLVKAPPITSERRALAEDWIRENRTVNYVQFQEHFTEKELDRAWFDAVHRRIKDAEYKETQPMPATATKPDKRTKTGDSQRVRDYLGKLSKAQLQAMTGKAYEKATRHKLKSPAVFYAEKKKLLDPAYAKARSQRAPTHREPAPAPHLAGTSVHILAEIPLAKYGEKVDPKVLREIVLDLVKQIHGGDPKVVLLAEPPTLEIRL